MFESITHQIKNYQNLYETLRARRCDTTSGRLIRLKPSGSKNIMQKMQRHANASCAIPAAPTGDWQDGLCHRWDQNISARMFFDGHSQTVHFMPCRIAFYLGKSRLITWKTWRHFRSTTGSSCQRLWNHAMYSALAWRHQTGTAQMPESFLTLLRR